MPAARGGQRTLSALGLAVSGGELRVLFPERLWETVLLLWTWVLAGLLVVAPPLGCTQHVVLHGRDGGRVLVQSAQGAGCGEGGEDTGVALLVPCGDNGEIAACV